MVDRAEYWLDVTEDALTQKSNKLGWFKMFPADWLVGTSGMSPAAKGCYIDMLCLQWSGVSLPADLKALSRKVTGMTPAVYRELSEHFEVIDGSLRNRRLARERDASDVLSARRSTQASAQWANASAVQVHCMSSASAVQVQCKRDGIGESESESESESETESINSVVSNNIPEILRNTYCAEPKKQRAKDPITWALAGGWSGISDADLASWAIAFPAAKIDMELEKANQWLISNPSKAVRSLWRRFLTNWLSRCQEGGGSRQGGSAAFQRDESHVPSDCAESHRHLWWLPDGRTRRTPPAYRTKSGEDKITGGKS